MVSGCSGSIAWLAFATSTTSTRSAPSCSRSAWPFAGTASGSSSPWMTSTGARPRRAPTLPGGPGRAPPTASPSSPGTSPRARPKRRGRAQRTRARCRRDAPRPAAQARRCARGPRGSPAPEATCPPAAISVTLRTSSGRSAGKATHNTVAEGVAHEVSRPARQVLDGSRRIIREIVQRQSRHGGGTVARAAGAYAGGSVAGGREVVHQRIEVVGAAPQGGDEDHQLPAAPHLYLDLAAVHCYSQRVPPVLCEPGVPGAGPATGYRSP